MRRFAIVEIYDDILTKMTYEAYGYTPQGKAFAQTGWVPIPPDDRLLQTIRRGAIALEDSIASYKVLAAKQLPGSDTEALYLNEIRKDRDALAQLRAAFGLNEDLESDWTDHADADGPTHEGNDPDLF